MLHNGPMLDEETTATRRQVLRTVGTALALAPLGSVLACSSGNGEPDRDAGGTGDDAGADAGVDAAADAATAGWASGGTAAMTGADSYPDPFADGPGDTCALLCS